METKMSYKLTARQKEIKYKNTEVVKSDSSPARWKPKMVIDHQGFTIAEFSMDYKLAEWYTDMLAIALDRFKYGLEVEK